MRHEKRRPLRDSQTAGQRRCTALHGEAKSRYTLLYTSREELSAFEQGYYEGLLELKQREAKEAKKNVR